MRREKNGSGGESWADELEELMFILFATAW
jgi:hypothetical protein